MGGGLMQLVAYGAQDIYLTGNPQITFFKVVYRRHTNFSMESIQQTWNGAPSSLTTAGRMTATISRNGDLVHKMYLQTDTTFNGSGIANPGSYMINTVEVEIGGQLIDKHYGDWMETFAQLTEPNSAAMLATGGNTFANATKFQAMSGMGGVKGTDKADGIKHIPLQFWFCRNPGLALPLIALQYHEVKIILSTKSMTAGAVPPLWVDYIYLDTDERRRFAQVSHEYLIEQVQTSSGHTASSGGVNLNFNHPVKELVWTRPFVNGSSATFTADKYWQLKLNGHDRFAQRDISYFTFAQVWQHHTGTPVNSAGTAGVGQSGNYIGVYSFALKPEEHQPSGTCNFSRIDNAQFCSSGTDTFDIYAVNYNVLRIMSGMGGLAYSN
tara:strand:- start:49 stop:1194 length:1146 start_codon:yes stop_codon:yes gene_type:complete